MDRSACHLPSAAFLSSAMSSFFIFITACIILEHIGNEWCRIRASEAVASLRADWSNLRTACLAFRVIRGISWIVVSEPEQTIHESHETHE